MMGPPFHLRICGRSLLVGVLLLLATSATADSDQKLSVLVGGGVSSYESHWPGEDTQSITSLRIGVEMQFDLRENLSFSTRALLNEYGGRSDVSIESARTELTRSFLTVMFPITVRQRFVRGRFTPYVRGGGELGFVLKAAEDRVVSDPEGVRSSTVDLSGSAAGLHFGLTAGAGVEFPVPWFTVDAEIGGTIGLTDLLGSSDQELRVRAGYFLLGFSRSLPKPQ